MANKILDVEVKLRKSSANVNMILANHLSKGRKPGDLRADVKELKKACKQFLKETKEDA